jgi:hypothetical protein
MFWPLGALGSFGSGAIEGYQSADEIRMNALKRQALADELASLSAFDPSILQGRGGGEFYRPPPQPMGPPPPMTPGGPPPQMAGPMAPPMTPSGPPPQALGAMPPMMGSPEAMAATPDPRFADIPRGTLAAPYSGAGVSDILGSGRDRVRQEIEGTPGLASEFDALTTAEVGREPQRRQMFQESVINEAVKSQRSLADVLRRRDYFPPETFARAGREGPSGIDVPGDIWGGSNVARFATGNASFDPRTGRMVGFQGGPVTAVAGEGRGQERFGLEGPGSVAWARSAGYEGPGSAREQAGMPPSAQTVQYRPPGAGGPEGMFDLGTLAQRIKDRFPNLSPAAQFMALQRYSGMLNEQGKSQLAHVRMQMQEEGLDLRRKLLEEQQKRLDETKRWRGVISGEPGYTGGGAPAGTSAAAGAPGTATADPGSQVVPGTGGLTRDALDFNAARLNITGQMPQIGGGTAGNLSRKALTNRAAELARIDNLDPKTATSDQMLLKARLAGMRTLETRAANLELAGAESEKLIPRVRDTSAKVDRTEYPSLNALIIAAQRGTGGTDVIKLGTAINSLIYVYARVLKPTGILNETDTRRAQDLLNIAWSNGQIGAALDQMEVELDSARQGLGLARERYAPLPGKGGGATAPTPATAPKGDDPLGLF